MPKCILCVFGWLGLAAGAGWLGPELCGAATPPLVSVVALLAGLLVGAAVMFAWRHWK